MKKNLLIKYLKIFYSLLMIIFLGLSTSYIGSFSYHFLIFYIRSSPDASNFPPIPTIAITFFVIIFLTPFLIKKLSGRKVIILLILYVISVFYSHFLLLSNVDYYIGRL